MTDEIEIQDFNGEGYSALISYNGWRVAWANFAERLLEKNLIRAERHLKTDEVFIPVIGKSTLFIGTKRKRCNLEIGKVYNVKCGVWHSLAMEENAKVVIVENDDTSDENSEFNYFENWKNS